MANFDVVVISHPPYSLDLAPATILLFAKAKITITGTIFQEVEDIKDLNAVPLDTSSNSYVQLLEICKKCVTVKGDYSERKQSELLTASFLSVLIA
jgi:hypothetical protein